MNEKEVREAILEKSTSSLFENVTKNKTYIYKHHPLICTVLAVLYYTMNSTFIGPTKSLCRSGVGGSSGRTRRNIVIQQQKRHRHQHQRQQQKDKGRHAVCTSRLITRDTSKGTMSSLLSSSSSSSSSRPISIRAISTSSSTDNTQSKTNKITGALAMTAAAAAAAGAVFLGVEQKKELQRKRENNETISREGVTMTTTSVAAKTTTTTTRTVIDTTGFLSMVTPHFQHDLYNNIHDVRTATNNSFRSLTFSDLIAKVNTISNNNNNNNAHTTSMEPLQRKTASAKNKLSPSRIHQPRNVMISRMRSVAGRGLHDKYNVDWKTVLGEGAYGSVHPARLALTGEKVSLI